jgi:hypothetical protein
MKRFVLIGLMTLPLCVWGQQSNAGDATPSGTIATSVTFPVERVKQPTRADLYCAGFLGKQISHANFVAGGLDSPFTTEYATGEVVFLKGKGYEAGQQYTIVRELRDPNRYELFPGQWASLKAAGLPYDEIATVKIVDTRNKTAVAQIEFSCGTVLPGDYAVPFADKSKIDFHPPMRIDRFLPANGQVTGRIILAKDFDSELGTGGKVYLNIGSSQGLKVGDYLTTVRSYSATAHDRVDSLSFKAPPLEPTQNKQPSVDPDFFGRTNGPEIHVAEMPRRAIGEIVILGTTPSTATGMIVYSLEPVHIGDRVEIDQQ